MKPNRIVSVILPFALAGLLLGTGCKKQNQPNANTANATEPAGTAAAPGQQTTAPPPPSDQAARSYSGSRSSYSGASQAPARSQRAAQQAPAPPPPPPPLVIPAGSHIAVTIQQSLGSRISQAGETFTATVAAPITVNGVTAIPAGASATGTVIAAHARGRFKGAALLELRLDSVTANGATYQIASSTLERAEKGKGKRSATLIGGGAGLGALIGGLAGGGKGALIGALAGGGAGTAGAGLTGNKDIVIPAESTLTFRIERAITVRQ